MSKNRIDFYVPQSQLCILGSDVIEVWLIVNIFDGCIWLFSEEDTESLPGPINDHTEVIKKYIEYIKIANIHISHLGTICVRKVKICNLLSKFYIYTTILYNMGRKSCISSVNSFILSIKQFQTQQSVISTLKSASPGIL